MTAWEAIKQAPRKLGEAAAARPQLVGLARPPKQRMSSLMFGILMVTVLVGGLVGALVLSTALQTREFELRAAQRSAGELAYQVSDLESKVNRAKAPQELGRRATELGMVPNPHGVFIDLATGKIDGKPVPASGNEIPSLRVVPEPVAAPASGVAAVPQDQVVAPEGSAPATTEPATDPTSAPPSTTPSGEPTAQPTAQPTGEQATGGQG